MNHVLRSRSLTYGPALCFATIPSKSKLHRADSQYLVAFAFQHSLAPFIHGVIVNLRLFFIYRFTRPASYTDFPNAIHAHASAEESKGIPPCRPPPIWTNSTDKQKQENCSKALKEAHQDMGAVDRANAAWDIIQAAADAHRWHFSNNGKSQFRGHCRTSGRSFLGC